MRRTARKAGWGFLAINARPIIDLHHVKVDYFNQRRVLAEQQKESLAMAKSQEESARRRTKTLWRHGTFPTWSIFESSCWSMVLNIVVHSVCWSSCVQKGTRTTHCCHAEIPCPDLNNSFAAAKYDRLFAHKYSWKDEKSSNTTSPTTSIRSYAKNRVM